MSARAFIWNFQSGRVDVTENTLGGTVEIIAIGPKDALAEYADRLLSDYHPMGYGTTVDDPKPVGMGEGAWRMNARRYSSCG